MTKSDYIIKQMKDYFKKHEVARAVVGISGGKDSTVCAALCVKAFGANNVFAVSMPRTWDKRDFDEQLEQLVVEQAGIDSAHVVRQSIGRAMEALTDGVLWNSPQAEMNIQARLRMTALYYNAQALGQAFVISTGNLDEALMGYCTLWGDMAGDYAPLKDLHVSEVIEVGRELGIKDDLLLIPPADGLSGKTDEENLGFTYAEVEALFEKAGDILCKFGWDVPNVLTFGVFGMVDDSSQGCGILTERERLIVDRWKRNRFKQLMCTVPGADARRFIDHPDLFKGVM